jgi:hypothetical protein
MSGEDLMVLRRMILAGRPLLPRNERESAAVAAYRSTVESVIHSTEGKVKRGLRHAVNGSYKGQRLPNH